MMLDDPQESSLTFWEVLAKAEPIVGNVWVSRQSLEDGNFSLGISPWENPFPSGWSWM